MPEATPIPTAKPAPAAPQSDELLIDGQEEVFSRTEVETGRIEHHSLEEDSVDRPSGARLGAAPFSTELMGPKGDPAEGKP